MTVTVEKMVTFDEKSYAEDVVNKLFEWLEDGWQEADWKCLTEEQQRATIKEILTEAIHQVEEGE